MVRKNLFHRPPELALPVDVTGGLKAQAPFNRDSLHVADSVNVTVSPKNYPGLTNPNPRGEWYYRGANVVLANDGALAACWQLSDNYTALMCHIFVAHSLDGGKTWQDYKSIVPANVWEDISVWVVPQMSVLRDGRMMIISDLGPRGPGRDFPMLSAWQKPGRGMSNHDFWGSDHGKTCTKIEKIENVGGEPGYILELTDGSLAYPDQFHRDHTVLLDHADQGVCGYSMWTQLPDERIVIVACTNDGSLEGYSWGGKSEGTVPFIRAYLVSETDLVGPSSP